MAPGDAVPARLSQSLNLESERLTRIAHSEAELSDQLARQVALVKRHLAAFPEEPLVALDLATKVRVLCHDTRNQRSLFSALGMRETLSVPSTTALQSSGNANAPFCGLVYVNLEYSGARFIPKFYSPQRGVEQTLIPLDEWWQETVLRDYEGRELNRRDLVLEMADTDGGAHVDGSLRETYHYISRQHSLSWTFTKNEGETGPVEGVELSSMAQIAYELVSVLDSSFSPPEFVVEGMLGEFSIHGQPGEAMFGRKLPFRMEMFSGTPRGQDRNRQCKCGSGEKMKRCCPNGTRVRVQTKPI